MPKKTQLESTTATKTPIKRLELRRETVRDLRVRTGVQTGGGAGSGNSFLTGPGVVSGSMSGSISLSGPESGSMFSFSLLGHVD
jgi:hypothetical protein